jgi:hypothetical protein
MSKKSSLYFKDGVLPDSYLISSLPAVLTNHLHEHLPRGVDERSHDILLGLYDKVDLDVDLEPTLCCWLGFMSILVLLSTTRAPP